jgi:hypothetical protein
MEELQAGVDSETSPEGATSQSSIANEQPAAPAEDFRQTQSKWDKQIALANQRAQQAERRAQMLEQQVQQTSQQIRHLATKDLGDYEKLQYELQETRQYAQQLAAEKAQIENTYQATMAQERLAARIEKTLGLDRKEFFDPTLSPDDLWEAAYAAQKKQGSKSSTPARRPAGDVDLGAGKGGGSDWDSRFAEAEKKRDGATMQRLLWERKQQSR